MTPPAHTAGPGEPIRDAAAGPRPDEQEPLGGELLDGPPNGVEPGIEAPETPEPQQNRRSLLLRGTAWQALGQFAPLVINIALTPYIIAGLGPQVYAVFLLISVIQSFMATLDGGIGPSANRYFALYAGKDDRVSTTRLLTTLGLIIAAISAVVFTLFFVFSARILAFFPATRVDPAGATFLLHTMVVLVAINQVRGLFAYVLFARHRFGVTTSMLLLGYVVYAIGLVWTIETHRGLTGIAWTFMVQQGIATLFIIPSACRFLSPQGIGIVPKGLLREFFGYSWKQQFSSALDVLAQYGDMLIVQRFRPAQVAHFGPGSTFAQQLRMAPLNAFAPALSMVGGAVGAEGERGGLATYEKIQRPWVLGVVGWFAVGVPASYFGVNSWLHNALGGSSLPGTVAAILLVGHLFALIAVVQIIWCLAVGRSDIELWYGLLALVLNLAATVALIIPFGVVGSVTATAVSQLVATAFLVRYMARSLDVVPVSPFAHLRVLPTLATVAASFAGTWAASRLVGAVVPYGGLGLIVTGVGAAPALVLYALWVFGLENLRSMLASRFPRFAR